MADADLVECPCADERPLDGLFELGRLLDGRLVLGRLLDGRLVLGRLLVGLLEDRVCAKREEGADVRLFLDACCVREDDVCE